MIQNGMSLSQVESIIGYYGDEMSSSGNVAIYGWSNNDGSVLTCIFEDGRVGGKSQTGLR